VGEQQQRNAAGDIKGPAAGPSQRSQEGQDAETRHQWGRKLADLNKISAMTSKYKA